MEKTEKIAVIGSTGKSGKYLVRELVNQSFYFKTVVRNPDKFIHQNSLAQVFIGDVKEYDIVRKVIEGCSAVISTLGLGIPPSEPTIFSQATQNIIQAMIELGVHRYIVITGLNVDTPFDRKGLKTKSATSWMYANYPVSTIDRQKEYDILTNSNVNWTLVRLPVIEQTDERGSISVSLEDCPGDKISAADLAHFLIGQLSDSRYNKQAPFIANT